MSHDDSDVPARERRRRCGAAWVLLRAQTRGDRVALIGEDGEVLAEGRVERNRRDDQHGRVFVVGGGADPFVDVPLPLVRRIRRA